VKPKLRIRFGNQLRFDAQQFRESLIQFGLRDAGFRSCKAEIVLEMA
jgi:hypothetical protein